MKKNIPPAKNNVHDYPGRCQKVVAVWPNGNVAGFFDSIKDAVDRYGFSRDGITNCCRGRQKMCGGLNWFYSKDFMPIYFSGDTALLKLPPDNIRNPDGTFKKGAQQYEGEKAEDDTRVRSEPKRKYDPATSVGIAPTRRDQEPKGCCRDRDRQCLSEYWPCSTSNGLYLWWNAEFTSQAT